MRRLVILAALAAVALCKEEEGCEQGYGHCHRRRLLRQSEARQADAERQMFREPWPADSELDKDASLLLQQVVVVHRHGDRAPLSMTIGSWEQTPELEDFWKTRLPAKSTIEKWGTYGTDSSGIYLKPKGEHSATGWPWGHLTNVGADQLRALGARLRERYVGSLSFLPSVLPAEVSSTIEVRSTRYPRTLHSVQNLLLGLYPIDYREDDAGGKPAPIAIKTVDKPEEYLDGGSDLACPRLGELRSQLDKGLKFPPRFTSAKAKVAERFEQGQDGKAYNVSMIRASEIGICHRAHGLPLPGSLTHSELVDITDLNGWQYWQRSLNKDISRLGIGPLVSDIVSGFDGIASGGKGPLIRVFSGHDTTLLPLLTAFGAHDGHWPPYASSMVFELLYDEREDKHLVSLSYNGKRMSLFGSKSTAPVAYADFKGKVAERMKPGDWKEQCKTRIEACGDGHCDIGDVVQN